MLPFFVKRVLLDFDMILALTESSLQQFKVSPRWHEQPHILIASCTLPMRSISFREQRTSREGVTFTVTSQSCPLLGLKTES